MADCKSCLGSGYFCSNCEHPGRTCVCDDLERGSADEIDCEACDGLGYARSSENDDLDEEA